LIDGKLRRAHGDLKSHVLFLPRVRNFPAATRSNRVALPVSSNPAIAARLRQRKFSQLGATAEWVSRTQSELTSNTVAIEQAGPPS
jgi:hypothetical protein